MTSEITNPSRRSVAKGAAWAVPAVAVAAAAPSLAASPGDPLTVTANCPGLLSGDSLTFTISNPDTGVLVPAGTPVDVTVTELVGLDVDLLVDINAGVLETDTSGSLLLADDLAPDESITLNIFPDSLLTAGVLGTATVSIEGVSAAADYILTSVNIPVVGTVTVALCN